MRHATFTLLFLFRGALVLWFGFAYRWLLSPSINSKMNYHTLNYNTIGRMYGILDLESWPLLHLKLIILVVDCVV